MFIALATKLLPMVSPLHIDGSDKSDNDDNRDDDDTDDAASCYSLDADADTDTDADTDADADADAADADDDNDIDDNTDTSHWSLLGLFSKIRSYAGMDYSIANMQFEGKPRLFAKFLHCAQRKGFFRCSGTLGSSVSLSKHQLLSLLRK
jgi:hypothetical protein